MSVALLAACSPDSRNEPAPTAATQPFTSVLEPVDSVVLRTGTRPIVRFSGLDVGRDGRFVIADRSEAQVHVFRPDGSLARSIGRRGFGPGEFYSPHSPRFGADGRIHIPDTRRGTISVFDSAGRFQREVSTRQFVIISTLEVQPDGSYLVGGLRNAADENVLFLMDSTGTIRKSMLPIGNRRPPGARRSPAWLQIRRPSFALRGDTVTAVLSISDSLWHVVHDGAPTAERVPINGYTPPRLPPGGPMDVRRVREWGRSFTTVADVFATDSSIAIPIVRGVLYEGDSAAVLFRKPDGRWVNLTAPPVLLRAYDGVYVGTPEPSADALSLVRYRRRR